jgi:hypothetical protein
MTEEMEKPMSETGAPRWRSRRQMMAAMAAAFDEWEDALGAPPFRPEQAHLAGYTEVAHVVDATPEQVADLARRVRAATSGPAPRGSAPAVGHRGEADTPTVALRILERLAAGTMSIDIAAELFATHEFAPDPTRHRATDDPWEGVFEDAEWTFGDAEFDTVTRAYMRNDLSREEFAALSDAAATSPDPGFQPAPPAELLRWDRIVAWRARLAGGDFGEKVPPKPIGDREWSMPFARLSETTRGFMGCLQAEAVMAPFDWPRWTRRRGRHLLADPVLLSLASLEDCRRLLAATVRRERFSEGAILRALEDGDIDRVLQRIEQLAGSH